MRRRTGASSSSRRATSRICWRCKGAFAAVLWGGKGRIYYSRNRLSKRMFWEAGFSCFFVRGRHIAASDERGAALVVRRLMAAYVRADAKRRCSASWDRESRAVAALRPAGYSSGRGDCARGGCSAGRCGSLGMSCTRSRLPLRFSRGVLCSITPAVCRVSAKQDGLRYVAFLFRRGS